MSDLLDSSQPPADGELWVKPFRAGGAALTDPFSIFKNPADAGRALRTTSRLGAFREAAGHIFLGSNLVVDVGRQCLANLIGGRDLTASGSVPTKQYVVTQCSWGDHDTVPRFTDTALSAAGANEIAYDGSLFKKALYSVDWPQPFIVRFEAVLEADEANDVLLKEMGLWTANTTLFARKVFPAIAKDSSFGLSFLWRVRF